MRKWLVVVGLIVVAGGGCLWLLQSQRSDDGLGGDSTSGKSGRTDGSSELLAGKAAPTLTGRAAARVAHDAVALQGRVVDAKSGGPIEGARVLVFRSQTDDAIREARSDKTGSFRVEGLAPGTWWILAIHSDYMPPGLLALVTASPGNPPPAALRVDVPADGSAPEERVIRLYAGARVRGRVIDESGAGVANARVIPQIGYWIDELEKRVGVSFKDWKDYFLIRSDANGRFAFGFLPPIVTSLRVGAVKDGLVGKWSEPVAPGSDEEVAIQLFRSATISGRVSTPDGSPAVGVQVLAHVPWEFFRDWLVWRDAVATDSTGAFTVGGLPPEDISVETSWIAPDMDGPEATAVDRLSPGEARTGISIVILQRYVVRARIRSARGVAMENEIFAISMDGPNLKAIETEYSDEKGLVAFALRTAGPFRLVHRTMTEDVVVKTGIEFPADLIEVVGEPTEGVRFTLRILDSNGALAPGYFTRIHSLAGDAQRNEELFRDNDYRNEAVRDVLIAGGLPVSVELRADMDERANLAIEAVTFTIDRIPPSGVVDVTLPRAGVFSGTVLDTKGRPVPGVQVKVVGRGPEQRLLARVPIAVDGTFAVPIPKTKRKARVVIIAPDGFLAVRPQTFDPKMPLHHIVLHPAGVVAGKVTVPNSADIVGKDLLVIEWGGEASEGIRRSQAVTVLENGAFEARRVPLDRPLTIGCDEKLAEQAGIVLPSRLQGVRAGQRDLVVVFDAALSIRGTVRVAGVQPKVMWVTGSPHNGDDPVHAKVAADGSFELTGLHNQRHALTVMADHSAVLDRRTVRAGETVAIEVGLRSSIAVRPSASGSVRVFVSGTVQLAAKAYVRGGTKAEITGLRPEQTYDVTIASGLSGAAYRTNVGVGETVELSMEPAVEVMGTIEGDESLVRGSALFARGENGCFELSSYEGEFGDTVAPGHYDIVALLADGTQRVLLRNATIGPDELVLNLTLK